MANKMKTSYLSSSLLLAWISLLGNVKPLVDIKEDERHLCNLNVALGLVL